MSFPRITAIMVCHTDNPTATRDEPSCQLLRAIWLMAQKEMKAMVFHVLRCGGRGRISSLIQTDSPSILVPLVVESVTNSTALFRIVDMAGVPSRDKICTARASERLR